MTQYKPIMLSPSQTLKKKKIIFKLRNKQSYISPNTQNTKEVVTKLKKNKKNKKKERKRTILLI